MSSFWVPMSKLVRVAFAAVLSAGESDVIILGPNVKTCGLCFLCGRILAGEPDVIILGPNVKTCGVFFHCRAFAWGIRSHHFGSQCENVGVSACFTDVFWPESQMPSFWVPR